MPTRNIFATAKTIQVDVDKELGPAEEDSCPQVDE